jgi:glycosyltransferase involved in cell wall biosynthesis
MMHEPVPGPAVPLNRLCVIILCDHGRVNGGQAKIAIESALHLKALGIDVCFIAGRGPIDERLVDAGIECHAVSDHDILSDPNRLRAGINGIWNRSAARLLAECLAAKDPRSTVVHVHGWAKVLSPSVGAVLARSETAHIHTLHEYFLACPNGGFFDYRAKEICKRRALGIDCLRTACDSRSKAHKAWRVARQAVLRTAGRMPSGVREVIYLAPEQRVIMEGYMPPEARWHHLPNPVGPQPQQRIRAEENDLFLFMGRLSPEKGAEVAAAAAKLAGVKIAFCGEGECRDAILSANPAAIMAGWVGQDELAGWMARARCVVFPSLWYECYPLVVADALRAGLPILVSDSCVAASSVAHGLNGLHVRAGDVQAWAQAMVSLGSAKLARTYSLAAFDAGKNLLGSDEYLTRLIDIYESAISRKLSQTAKTAERIS